MPQVRMPDQDLALAEDQSIEAWRGRTRVVLGPIAAPSILGLYGFAGATFIVASHLAGWWGDTNSPRFIAPFALFFGGLAQFLAGMWSYKARDAVATAMHGMWGAFWLAWGLLFLLIGAGVLTPEPGPEFVALGFWFIPLAGITYAGALSALKESISVSVTLWLLAIGSTLVAVGEIGGFRTTTQAAGWVLVASAVAAWYAATAMMLEASWGKVVLPLGKPGNAEANRPGGTPTEPIEFKKGMPGLRQGQ